MEEKKMKKTIRNTLFIMALCTGIAACAGDGEEIGAPIEITPEYELPQKGASDAANARILNYYNKYGSYVVYDFSNKDAWWLQVTGNSQSGGRTYHATTGDFSNVDAMLDYIEDIWLKYFSDDFLKKGGMPYRVFLADSVYMKRDWDDGTFMITTQNYAINGNGLIIGGMNQVSTMDATTKKARKIELFTALWAYYRAQGLLSIPNEFYAETDYVTKPTMTKGQWGYEYTADDIAALRNRGFMPKYSQYGYSVYDEIYMKYSDTYDTWNGKSDNDIRILDYDYYMTQILNATDEAVADYLAYPAVKKKWDCLINFYKTNYSIDLRAIAKE